MSDEKSEKDVVAEAESEKKDDADDMEETSVDDAGEDSISEAEEAEEKDEETADEASVLEAEEVDEPADAEAPAPVEEPLGEEMIVAEGLSKYYGEFTAVEDVSFTVHRGQVVAFLGPNGAGKSTTMRILAGMLVPDRGTARIAGLSVTGNRIAVARKLGYLPENGPLYEDMTPRTILYFLGSARGLTGVELEDRVNLVIDQLALDRVQNKLISKLSKGYRQRVGLAQALLHEPEVMILDEPTTGLDPNQIRSVRETIRNLGETKAILLSTHILQEVKAVADRVVFIHEGRIAFDGTLEELEERGPSLDDVFRELAPTGEEA